MDIRDCIMQSPERKGIEADLPRRLRDLELHCDNEKALAPLIDKVRDLLNLVESFPAVINDIEKRLRSLEKE